MDFEKTRVFLVFFKLFGKKLTKTAKFEKKDENNGVFIKNMFFGLEWPKIIKDNKGSGWPGFHYNMVISRLWLFLWFFY